MVPYSLGVIWGLSADGGDRMNHFDWYYVWWMFNGYWGGLVSMYIILKRDSLIKKYKAKKEAKG